MHESFFIAISIKYLHVAMAGQMPEFPCLVVNLYCLKIQIKHHYLKVLQSEEMMNRCLTSRGENIKYFFFSVLVLIKTLTLSNVIKSLIILEENFELGLHSVFEANCQVWIQYRWSGGRSAVCSAMNDFWIK